MLKICNFWRCGEFYRNSPHLKNSFKFDNKSAGIDLQALLSKLRNIKHKFFLAILFKTAYDFKMFLHRDNYLEFVVNGH